MLDTIISQLVTYALIPILTAVSIWVARELIAVAQKFRENLHVQWAQALYDEATKAVEDAVGQLMQTSISQLKASAADGKLTLEEGKAAFETAVKVSWQSLAQSVRDGLVKLTGSAALAQQQVIAPKVESAVARAKVTGMDKVSQPITDPNAQATAKVVARQALGLSQ